MTRAPHEVEVNLSHDDQITVIVRPMARAKNLTLRFDFRQGGFTLTVPPFVKEREINRFLHERRDWMNTQRQKHLGHDIADGASLTLNGNDYHVRFTNSASRSVDVSGAEILVGGPTDMAPQRLARHLAACAQSALSPMVRHHANAFHQARPLTAIKFGDMRSRWGSCSSSGVIKLSWRLIMAPTAVQNYVAAHEAAHLVEMNHSNRFWALVEQQVPDWKHHRNWLRTDGMRLQSIRF